MGRRRLLRKRFHRHAQHRSTGQGRHALYRLLCRGSRLFPDPEYLDKAEDLDFAVAFARIECHYFINAIFVEEAYILNHVDTIQHIPTVIVQGRYDVVCPPRSAWELHQAMPESHLVMVADAGHSMGEVSIARELVAATDALR